MFWLIMTPDHVFRVPKPWGAGVLFGSVPERLLDAFIAEKPQAFKGLMEQFFRQNVPEFTPTAFQPIVEQFANHSTFTNRTIVPSSQEKWLPEYQQTPYTTELAKAIGRVVGSFYGMEARIPGHESFLSGPERAITSPPIFENYVQAWTGGLGIYALNLVDFALRKAGVLPDPIQPTKTLADYPLIKAFVVRYPSATTESIQTFHDRYASADSYYQTWLAKSKEGDISAMQHIQTMGGPEMFTRLQGVSNALSVQQRLIQNVLKTNIAADQKRQIIDQTYYAMIQTAQMGNKIMDAIEESMKR
jgi:hypothetical protein